jgi:hypothetical protein
VTVFLNDEEKSWSGAHLIFNVEDAPKDDHPGNGNVALSRSRFEKDGLRAHSNVRIRFYIKAMTTWVMITA